MNNLVIGTLKLDGNLVLAPMSGVTSLIFRLLCRNYGASLVYSEMTSSESVVRKNQKSIERGFTCGKERPMGIQLMGSDPVNILKSALILQKIYKPGLVDVNFGCPSSEIIKNGCGSQLLKDPDRIDNIIRSLHDSMDIPVTAKIRILENFDKTLKIARIIEKSGADAVTIHGRTQKQGYSGASNLDFIKKIKSELTIPVIANGDITDEKSAGKILEYTQCDGLMIGRAAIGNPFIFKRVSHYLKTGEILVPEKKQRLDDFFRYMDMCRDYGMLTFNDLKLNAQRFTKGIENVKQVRVKLNEAEDVDTIIGIMRDLRKYS